MSGAIPSSESATNHGRTALVGYQGGDQATSLISTQTQILPSNELENSDAVQAESTEITPAQEASELSEMSNPVGETDRADTEIHARQVNWMGEYRIEMGDSLELKFRVSNALNDVVTVRPDGMISLQIVGDQPAAGLTPEQLREQLRAAYSQHIITPDLAVIVRSFSGNVIYIGGEVNTPGRVPLTGRVTTLKAVILAGGFKDTADRKRVVVRHEDGTCCQYDLKSVIECESGGRDIALQPSDIVYVPKSCIAKVNLFVDQYIEKVLPFERSAGIFVTPGTGPQSAM